MEGNLCKYAKVARAHLEYQCAREVERRAYGLHKPLSPKFSQKKFLKIKKEMTEENKINQFLNPMHQEMFTYTHSHQAYMGYKYRDGSVDIGFVIQTQKTMLKFSVKTDAVSTIWHL